SILAPENDRNNSRCGKSGSLSARCLSADLNAQGGNGASIYSLNRTAEALSADTCTEDIEKGKIMVWG
ncbi:MAG: hypothetical protein WBQ10_23265, partial [Terriglobales bacterium]